MLVTIALQVAVGWIGMSGTVMAAVAVLLSALVGFEAATMRRFTLARRRWSNIGTVVGDDAESAERRFFDAWVDKTWASAPPASSPPPGLAGTLSRRPPASPEVIGLLS